MAANIPSGQRQEQLLEPRALRGRVAAAGLARPAGNFSEYYSDMDCIIDHQLWTPGVLEGARGPVRLGPAAAPSFLHPGDLAAMMTGAHSAR